MTDSSPGPAARPLSPHLQVWRWHVTLFCSIAHRATGMALYAGALMLAGWAVALASGPGGYEAYKAVLGSLPGKLVLFGMTVSIFFHLATGVRHLVWDTGHGFKPKDADLTGVVAMAFGIAAAVVVWIIAALMGAL